MKLLGIISPRTHMENIEKELMASNLVHKEKIDGNTAEIALEAIEKNKETDKLEASMDSAEAHEYMRAVELSAYMKDRFAKAQTEQNLFSRKINQGLHALFDRYGSKRLNFLSNIFEHTVREYITKGAIAGVTETELDRVLADAKRDGYEGELGHKDGKVMWRDSSTIQYEDQFAGGGQPTGGPTSG